MLDMTLKDYLLSKGGKLDALFCNECHTDEVDADTGLRTARTFLTFNASTGVKLNDGTDREASVSVGLSKKLTAQLQDEHPEVLTNKKVFMAWVQAHAKDLRVVTDAGTVIPSMFLPGEGRVDGTEWFD